MRIISLFIVTLFCAAYDSENYAKTVNAMLDTLIKDPTDQNYFDLHFFIHANTPRSPILETTEKSWRRKIDQIIIKHHLGQDLHAVYGTSCALENFWRNCGKIDEKITAEIIKNDLAAICKKSRNSVKNRNEEPVQLIMNKNDYKEV